MKQIDLSKDVLNLGSFGGAVFIGSGLVGLAGLGSVGALKRSIGTRASWSDRDKGVWKALTYVAICAWTFLLSQRTFAGLGILGWLPA